MTSRIVIIGVGGVTNGGKSTMCRWLSQHLKHRGISSTVLHMDDYFYHDDYEGHLLIPEYNNEIVNWDRPEAVNFEALVKDLNKTISNYSSNRTDNGVAADARMLGELTKCEYLSSCELCAAVSEGESKLCQGVFSAADIFVIFVEGIMIFDSEKLQKLFTLRYFVCLDIDEVSKRRSLRNYPRGEPQSYFERYAWPCYLRTLDDVESNNRSLCSCTNCRNFVTEDLQNSHRVQTDVVDADICKKCENDIVDEIDFNTNHKADYNNVMNNGPTPLCCDHLKENKIQEFENTKIQTKEMICNNCESDLHTFALSDQDTWTVLLVRRTCNKYVILQGKDSLQTNSVSILRDIYAML